jgi:hypothetical protein
MPRIRIALPLVAGLLLSACTTMNTPSGLKVYSAQEVNDQILIKFTSPTDIYAHNDSPMAVSNAAFFCEDKSPEIASMHNVFEGRKHQAMLLYADDDAVQKKATNVPPGAPVQLDHPDFRKPADRGFHTVAVNIKFIKILWNPKGDGVGQQVPYDLRTDPKDLCFYLEIGNYKRLGYRSNTYTLPKDMIVRTLDGRKVETFPSP